MQTDSHALPPQVLYANVACLNLVGCARGIKHLALQIQNPHCGHLSSAICGLQQLETWWLADFEGPQSEPQTSGALQLYTLQCLRSLALTNVVPEGISCSENCELHVDLELDFRSMEHPVWDTVLPHVRSVTLFGLSPALVALPSILCKAGKLMKADVVVDYCGMAHAPLLLDGSLAHVEELVMRCRELHAIVPAHVTWRNIYVAATHLNLRFEAVAPFGEAIPAFCFRFKELKVCYPQETLFCLFVHGLSCFSCTLTYSVIAPGDSLISVGCCCGKEAPGVGWNLG